MPDIAVPVAFPRLAGAARRRAPDLVRLAREVEPHEPGLAVELRGMALHEACAAQVRAVAARPAWWRRAARGVWDALVAYGEARARRDILALAERWQATQPELARELRAACARQA